MDLIDRLRELSNRINAVKDRCTTEEGTKNALVMPFLVALGYDVFNPHEVVPEFTADVGTKRGEKVDYAILRGDKPAILVECKVLGDKLDAARASQLYRYFSVTSARFAILTDGARYLFFTDLDSTNLMDSRPFLEVDLREIDERAAAELRKFTKELYDEEQILTSASTLKYLKGMRRALAEEWTNPSEDFVKLLASRVYEGRLTPAVKEEFTQVAKRAFQEFVNDLLNRRLQSAMTPAAPSSPPEVDESAGEPEPSGKDRNVVTTQEEIEAFYLIKGILRTVVDPNRIYMRDTQSYCGILLDDNNRKPICRLLFNTAQKYVATLDEQKNPTRHPIDRLDDLYRFADDFRAAVERYTTESGPAEAEQPDFTP